MVVPHLNLVTYEGQTILFSNLPAVTILPIRAKRIMETTTTATLIIAMW